MKKINTGFSFGLTSGIITTIGLLIGLSGTNNKLIIITGVLTIAIADSFSDALGIHVSEESDKKNSKKDIWKSTVTTFITKFVIASSFLIPIIFLDINEAIFVSSTYGLILLGILSYKTAKIRKDKPIHSTIEHLTIALIVIVITKLISTIL
jgi:VIT1/CCC1 family predicted Fe2+/Mn2+ transporter